MLVGGAAVQLDAVPEAFDPILEVVNSYKTISKQAAVFEWRVGKGRLLVCSLNLPGSDPAAAYFRGCLLTDAAGEQFRRVRRSLRKGSSNSCSAFPRRSRRRRGPTELSTKADSCPKRRTRRSHSEFRDGIPGKPGNMGAASFFADGPSNLQASGIAPPDGLFPHSSLFWYIPPSIPLPYSCPARRNRSKPAAS